MNLHQAPLQETLKPDRAASYATGTQIHGIRLLIMRVLWTILTGFNLVIFFGSIPAYYAQLFTICTAPHPAECNFGQPTPGSIAALHHLGISLSSYAAYTLGVSIFASSIFLIMGLLLFWRKSDEWMAIFASIVLIIFAGVGDARATAFQLPGDTIVLILSTLILGLGGYCGLGLFFALFPNGRPVPRWAWMLVFLWFVQTIPWAIPPDSPYQILNWPPLVFAGEQLLMWGTTMGVQIYRYTLVSDQVQRQQSKWLIFGFALALLIDVPYSAVLGLFPALAAPDSPYLLFSATVWELFLVFIPIAIAVAILRYRLWDIDIIINRALVYGTLTASVIGLYVLVVGGLGLLLQIPGNVLLSLLATGLIAILFQPLRQRLQQGVNQLMYGERDDPYRVLARLGQRLEATLTPDAVLPMIVETVAQALKLPFAAILWTPQDGAATSTVLAAYGESYDQTAEERIPLIYQNEVVGDLVLLPRQRGEVLTPADKRFLRDLAPQIGVAVHAVRLTAHLKQLTVDLQRSRERLVTAREEERRRLRRDLHDGLGPQLSSQTLTLSAIKKLLRQDPDTAEQLLTDATTHAQEAIADIRRLVYALRPPALDDLGLLAALQEQIAHYHASGIVLRLEAPEALPLLPAAIEIACYRIVQEALTNVVRHAHATYATVGLCLQQEMLVVEVRDDGQGLPVGVRSGVGLNSMRERAEELGGTCLVETIAEGGTRVCAQLPLPIGLPAENATAEKGEGVY